MNARPEAHPADTILHAYAVGKLDEHSLKSLVEHLEVCSECRRRLRELPDDSFVDKLKAAKILDGTPAPPDSAWRAAMQGDKGPPATPSSPPPGIPPELAGLPGYTIVRELGRGGMGIVYLARNTAMDRPEVLKVMNKTLVGKPEAVERFLQEIRSAGRLSHANVAIAHSTHQLGDLLVLAMEYVEGDDLAKVVRTRGALSIPNACFCVHQVALGLQRGHELGLVHRDIKPGNILLAKQGKRPVVKVIDFGLAKAKTEVPGERELTGTNQMMGTPGYTAPEQLNDAKNADTRSDIYSLGCTLYCLLAGEPPFQGDSIYAIFLAQETNKVRPLRDVRPEVPEQLAAIVAKMMDKDPAKRFQQPAEVAAALVPFVKQGPKPTPNEVDPSAPRQPAAETFTPTGTIPGRPRPAATPQGGPKANDKQPMADPWSGVADSAAAPSERRGARPTMLAGSSPLAARKRRRAVLLVGVTLLCVAVGLAGAVIFRLQTQNGTILVEGVPADARVSIDGRQIEIVFPGDKDLLRVEAPEGRHELKVIRGGFEAFARQVTFKSGEPEQVKVTWVPNSANGSAQTNEPSKRIEDGAKPKQLEDLAIEGSFWRGTYSFTNQPLKGEWRVLIQERSGNTFRGFHLARRVENGVFFVNPRPIEGVIKGNEVQYSATTTDSRFTADGSWKDGSLKMVFHAVDGSTAEGTLKLAPEKTKSARIVVSVFDRNDAEGWYTLNQDDTENATHPITVDYWSGNYYLAARCSSNINEFGWHAPKKFHGDHSGKFGQCLTYSLWSKTVGAPPATDWYVRLRGAEMTLYLDGTNLDPPPSDKWKNYCVRLDASRGWKVFGTGQRATDEEIKKVLGDVTDLRIKGEFGFKSDGCIDSVEFGTDDPYANIGAN